MKVIKQALLTHHVKFTWLWKNVTTSSYQGIWSQNDSRMGQKHQFSLNQFKGYWRHHHVKITWHWKILLTPSQKGKSSPKVENSAAFRDLVPFAQFRNAKNTHGRVLLLVPATLLKVTLFRGFFSCFLDCTNGCKSGKASHMITKRANWVKTNFNATDDVSILRTHDSD